jgi:hypothetical protein
MNEDSVWHALSDRLKNIQSTECINFEVVEGHFRGEIMAWLSRCMDNQSRVHLFHNLTDSNSISNVNVMMAEMGVRPQKTGRVSSCVSFRTEEIRPHVVINAVDLPSLSGEIVDYFAPYEARRSGDHESVHCQCPNRRS